MKWISGSPTVNIDLNEYLSALTSKNPHLLISYMGGWTREKLKNPSLNDKIKLNFAGVKSLIKTYQLGGAKKDKAIDKLALLNDQDLENSIKEKLK